MLALELMKKEMAMVTLQQKLGREVGGAHLQGMLLVV